MAKTKDAYYFSHDSNARNDQKMLLLRSKYGYEGYGIFWAIVEVMRDATDYKLNIKHISALSIAINFPEEKLKEFVKDCIDDFNLFTQKDDNYYSLRLLNSMKKRMQLQSKMSANAKQRHNKSNALKERKGKEIKGKESKGNSREFVPPSLTEVKIFFNEKGYTEQSAIQAFNHYDLNSWHDSQGTPVRNWKQKMSNNWFKQDHKIPPVKKPLTLEEKDALFGEVA